MRAEKPRWSGPPSSCFPQSRGCGVLWEGAGWEPGWVTLCLPLREAEGVEPPFLRDSRAPLHRAGWPPVPREDAGGAGIGDGAIESRLLAEPGGGGGGGGGVRR